MTKATADLDDLWHEIMLYAVRGRRRVEYEIDGDRNLVVTRDGIEVYRKPLLVDGVGSFSELADAMFEGAWEALA